MKKLLLILSVVCFSEVSKAQTGSFGYYEDALRFSQSNYSLGSTARMQSIGGAQISLGGDISSAVSNPAGLGFFNKSVITISPSLNFSSVDTDYFVTNDTTGTQSTEETFYNNLNIGNVGVVINWNKGRFTDEKFKGGSLAISINRANGYRLERFYQGENKYNSLADALALDAGTVDPNDLGELAFAAYDQYLISPSIANENIEGYFADFDGSPIQSETIKESGSHYQMNIAWGGNYDDRFYFGGGMGIQFLNYEKRRIYQESDFAVFDADGNFFGLDERLNAFTLDDNLDIRGTGVNFNVGVIARPVSFMTVGLSYTSPSFISFDEESFIDLDADWREGAIGTDGEDISNIDPYQSALFVSGYNLRTPTKVGVGATLFVGKNGFLSGDVEYLDYAAATLNSGDFSTSGDNAVIEDIYRSVFNVRIGGEYRIENFMMRAGYALFPSAYKDSNLDERSNLTFGVGYRTPDYFLDLGVVKTERSISYVPYFIGGDFQPEAFSDIKNTSVVLTFGFNF